MELEKNSLFSLCIPPTNPRQLLHTANGYDRWHGPAGTVGQSQRMLSGEDQEIRAFRVKMDPESSDKPFLPLMVTT